MAAIDKIERSELPGKRDETGNSSVSPEEAEKLRRQEWEQGQEIVTDEDNTRRPTPFVVIENYSPEG